VFSAVAGGNEAEGFDGCEGFMERAAGDACVFAKVAECDGYLVVFAVFGEVREGEEEQALRWFEAA
jgi:hypothetical protein